MEPKKTSKSEIKIKNPQKAVLRNWILVNAFFIVLGLRSMMDFDINSADGMFIMISLLVVLTSLFFIGSIIKNIKMLDGAINRKKLIVHWTYTKKEWLSYLDHEGKYRSDEARFIAFTLFAITLLVFIPFILIIPEGKLAMFFVLLGLIGFYGFMGWIAPSIRFYYKRMGVGEVILLEKGVLLNKQFHTWDFPLSKFGSATFSKTPYEHLVIVYNFWDRTGSRSYVINVPIPRSNKKNIKSIISKFK